MNFRNTLNPYTISDSYGYQPPLLNREPAFTTNTYSPFDAPMINPPKYGIQGEIIRNVLGEVVGTYNPLLDTRRY